MAQELIYTSFPKGVKPGVSGFCTVAVSPNMAPNLISRLEGLSGYRHLFMPGTPEADLNPPNWSHVVINVGNTELHVIYRVADAGLDYTGRSNKLAHFIVLDKNDQAPCGPAAMLTTPGLIDLTFDQQVGTRAFTRQIPRQLVSPRPCLAWRQAAGDPGWAGELAQTAWTGKYACIVYKPGMNVLALIQEAMALLPLERRWKTTFSTYYSKLPTGIDCQWRCVAAGTPEAAQAIAEVGSGLVIDLSNGALAPAADSPAVAAARAGRMVLAPAGAKSGGIAPRQRPVQASRPAAEAAVNASIQDELQTIDSTPVNDPEAELINAVDSMPQFTVNARKKKKPQAAAGKKFGLYAALFAVIFLIGIAVATYCVVTSVTSQNDSNAVAVNQTNQDSDDAGETTDEPDVEPAEQNADLEQNPVNDQNEGAAPVTAPDAVSDQNQPQEGDSVNNSDKGDSQPEEQNADTDQNSVNDQNEAPAAQANTETVQEPQEDEEAKKAEQAKLKEEREKKLKQQKETEDKIFNDPRWAGMDRNQYFIYVDSNDTPNLDFERLNIQLRKRNSNIVKLVPIQLDNEVLTNFELKQDESDPLIYDVRINDDPKGIKIRLKDIQGKTDVDSTEASEENNALEIEFNNKNEFKDFMKKCALLATFADNKSSVISFFKEDNSDNKKIFNQFKSSFRQVMKTPESTLEFRYDNIAKPYVISEIKPLCYGDTVTISFEKSGANETAAATKTYKIVSHQFVEKTYEIRIEINYTYKKRQGLDVVETKFLRNLVVCVNKSNRNFCKIKWSFENNDGRPMETKQFHDDQVLPLLIKQILLNLPLYMDVYVGIDPIEGSPDVTHEQFFWKRIVLPPPEGTSK